MCPWPFDDEYFEEWCNRSDEERNVSFSDYSDSRHSEDYGDAYKVDDNDDSACW